MLFLLSSQRFPVGREEATEAQATDHGLAAHKLRQPVILTMLITHIVSPMRVM